MATLKNSKQPSFNPAEPVLMDWISIAEYMGKGVRTVQRWERELGMPVRRKGLKGKSCVIARPAELDAWLRGFAFRKQSLNRFSFKVQAYIQTIADLQQEVAELRWQLKATARPHNAGQTAFSDASAA